MTDSTNTMHAWRFQIGDPNLKRRKISVPKPGPNEVLVRVLAAGVCHSDCLIQSMKEPAPTWSEEFTMGHEGAGEIVKLGPGVESTDFDVGDRVAVHLNPGCRQCTVCKQGLERICKEPNNGAHGLGRDGFFQEYVAARTDALVKIPSSVRIEAAAIASDAILTAYHGVKYAAEVKSGQTIVLFGMGGLGLNGLQTAQHLGAKRILVCDRKQEALDLAIKLGIPPEDAICTAEKPFHETIAERNLTIDTVIDFVGHEQTLLSAQLAVRPGGTIVVVGILSPQAPLIPMLAITKVITIKGTYAGTVAGLKECLGLIAQGIIRPELSTASIEYLPQVLQDLDEGKYQGRKVLLPDWKEA